MSQMLKMNWMLRTVLVVVPTILRGEGFEKELAQVKGLGELVDRPAMRDAEGFEAKGGVKAIYYDALDWKGKPTKVFAWLGVPERSVGKVPGVVLVHGGGGTAFQSWVEKWNERGFAAISIAVEGQTDRKEGKGPWEKHEWAGPSRVGIYGDSNQPLKDQWMYHAVADTVLAHSLLRSFPGVDETKVGLMGTSWGGVITSTVMGIDERFAFAIPVYGCGALAEAGNQYGRALGNNALYQKVWDPMVRMKEVTMPTLWFSWPGDTHFPLDKQAKCYQAMSGPYLVSLIPGLRHGHGPPWNKPDSYAFAQRVVGQGMAGPRGIWCRERAAKREGSRVTVTFETSREAETGVLVSTIDEGVTGDRTWVETPAELEKMADGWRVSGELSEGTTAWFVNLSSGGLTASSDFQLVD
ncbi:MAG: alpha/beta hydrolase family protein [Roseibacillus sp.]